MHRVVINSILILILVIMSYSLYRVLDGRASEETNVAKVRQLYSDSVALSKKLADEYKYYNSSEYIEKVSRDNLDLAPKGEYMIILPTITPTPLVQQGQFAAIPSSSSNLQKWLSLLVK